MQQHNTMRQPSFLEALWNFLLRLFGRRRRQLLDTLQIDLPNPTVTVDAQGLVTVQVTYNGTDSIALVRVFAQIYPPTQTTAPTPHLGDWNLLELSHVTGTLQFTGSVPVDAAHLAPSAPNNIVWVWAMINNGGLQAPEGKTFTATVAANATVTVDARRAIWFAWAPRPYVAGPFGETDDPKDFNGIYRAYSLIVPQDALHVTCTASGTWRHIGSPSTETSGPDGNGTSDDLLVPAYRSANYNSQFINNKPLPLNRLVGLWQPPTLTTATDEIDMGSNFSNKLIATFTVIAPNGTSSTVKAKRFWLAFHDGQQWPDNSGSVTVQVAWSTT